MGRRFLRRWSHSALVSLTLLRCATAPSRARQVAQVAQTYGLRGARPRPQVGRGGSLAGASTRVRDRERNLAQHDAPWRGMSLKANFAARSVVLREPAETSFKPRARVEDHVEIERRFANLLSTPNRSISDHMPGCVISGAIPFKEFI